MKFNSVQKPTTIDTINKIRKAKQTRRGHTNAKHKHKAEMHMHTRTVVAVQNKISARTTISNTANTVSAIDAGGAVTSRTRCKAEEMQTTINRKNKTTKSSRAHHNTSTSGHA